MYLFCLQLYVHLLSTNLFLTANIVITYNKPYIIAYKFTYNFIFKFIHNYGYFC